MKNAEYISAVLANYVPALCAAVLYRGGAPLVGPILIILQIYLLYINYKTAAKRSSLAFLSDGGLGGGVLRIRIGHKRNGNCLLLIPPTTKQRNDCHWQS